MLALMCRCTDHQNCSTYKNSETIEFISIQEEVEQDIIKGNI